MRTRRASRGSLGSGLARLGCLALAASAAGAAQWVVDDDGPADFSSIQAAINAVYVHGGDTLLVKPGRYPGNVYLDTKDLVIRSEAGPWATILDAQGAGSVVYLYNRSPGTRIEGFTLTGGWDQTGGGIWIYGGGPVVTRNVIEGNSAVGGYLGYGYGGGIEVYGSAAVITRNLIRGNSALDGGGGIDVYYAGPSTPGTCCPLIANNTIVGNSVTSAAGIGGGILTVASEPRVTSSILSGNSAAAGGGLYVERVQGNGDSPTVAMSILHANTADDFGSNDRWRLPSSNRLVDPRLGEGNWFVAWPRSDSPALDAGEAGLPVWPDLAGLSAAADSDLDGAAEPDVGAVENRGEITMLVVGAPPGGAGAALLSWDPALDAGTLFDLYGSDLDPFVSGGGACLAPGLTAPSFTDSTSPPAGAIRYYLVAGRRAVAGTLGLRSDGSARPVAAACSVP